MWEDRYEWAFLLGDQHKVETYKEGKNRFINLGSETQGNMCSLSKNAAKFILLLIGEVILLYFIGGGIFLVNSVFIFCLTCFSKCLVTSLLTSLAGYCLIYSYAVYIVCSWLSRAETLQYCLFLFYNVPLQDTWMRLFFINHFNYPHCLAKRSYQEGQLLIIMLE